MKQIAGIRYIFLILVGILILLYPYISSSWNRYRDQQLISSHREWVDTQPEQEKEKMWQVAQSYNNELGIQPVPDAFSLREGIHDPKYETVLNASQDGMMGYVEIPKIDIELPIYHYTSDSVLQKGAGHLFGSALPVGGDGSHTVVSAHRGLPNAEMFTNLPQLEKGDQFYFHVLGEILAYEVDWIQVVKPNQVSSLSGIEGEDYAALITCTPYGINTERILVRGKRVPYDKKDYEKAQSSQKKVDEIYLAVQVVCGVLGFLLSLLIILFVKKRDQKRKNKESM